MVGEGWEAPAGWGQGGGGRGEEGAKERGKEGGKGGGKRPRPCAAPVKVGGWVAAMGCCCCGALHVRLAVFAAWRACMHARMYVCACV